MISIITAIYNQRAVNELFWNNLKKFTYHKFELIIIDNGSTDGSAEFFESVGATVIRNNKNYSYPYCQNQGIRASNYEWLAFLNNDIIVSPKWDKYMISSMEVNLLEVATVCGIEQVENFSETKKLKRRWKKIKNLLSLFGKSKLLLNLMHKFMYGNWIKFNKTRNINFLHKIKEGFVGNTVFIKRNALEKIGYWDERLQGADFDLCLRTKKRSDSVGDIKPVHICLDVFNHHYIRLTAKSYYPPFADSDNLISIEEKWSESERSYLKNLNK